MYKIVYILSYQIYTLDKNLGFEFYKAILFILSPPVIFLFPLPCDLAVHQGRKSFLPITTNHGFGHRTCLVKEAWAKVTICQFQAKPLRGIMWVCLHTCIPANPTRKISPWKLLTQEECKGKWGGTKPSATFNQASQTTAYKKTFQPSPDPGERRANCIRCH